MRDIDMERVNGTREKMLETVKSPVLTHEQKVAAMANLADSLLEVVDLPEGLHDLMDQPIDSKCICDLAEGHAPLRPRYIIPDYKKFMREGSKFLQLDPPKDLFEALNSLLIFYKHVPSVTNFPVYLGALDELLDPFVQDMDEELAKKMIRLFLIHVDRTVLDSFSHANVGPRDTKAGRIILEVEAELEQAVPNITMKYDEDITSDEFALMGVNTTLHSAKPSFANHKMFKSELGEDYVIASCYNGGGKERPPRALRRHRRRDRRGTGENRRRRSGAAHRVHIAYFPTGQADHGNWSGDCVYRDHGWRRRCRNVADRQRHPQAGMGQPVQDVQKNPWGEHPLHAGAAGAERWKEREVRPQRIAEDDQQGAVSGRAYGQGGNLPHHQRRDLPAL